MVNQSTYNNTYINQITNILVHAMRGRHVANMHIPHTYDNNMNHRMYLIPDLDAHQNYFQQRNGIIVWGIT